MFISYLIVSFKYFVLYVKFLLCQCLFVTFLFNLLFLFSYLIFSCLIFNYIYIFTFIYCCPFGPKPKPKLKAQFPGPNDKQASPSKTGQPTGPSKPIPSGLGLHGLSCKPASPRPSACFIHDQAFAQQGLPTWLHPNKHAWPLASLMQLPHADRDTRTTAVSSLPATRPPIHSLSLEDP